jgi:uncharacterized protein (DUF433 family)
MICGGKPVLKDTRVTLRMVLASLAEGASTEEILADFPTLTAEDVRAVVAFAPASTEEELQTEEVESWNHCFVVATDRKIRITRPSQTAKGSGQGFGISISRDWGGDFVKIGRYTGR